MTETIRTSFSQNMIFDGCPRHWLYQYVLKIPAVSDMCYAHAGSVIHSILERWYSNKFTTIESAKEGFYKEWKRYNLDNSKIKNKRDNYWLMIINGINLIIPITTTEMKIFYPDVVGYLDAANTNTDKILDWKSSTRSKINEEEYTMQLKFYSWLYYRKFNRIPKKVSVYYLKYTGTKGVLEFEPTLEDIKEAEKWHTNIQKEMLEIKANKQVPNIGSKCSPWCPYENICQNEQTGILNFDLHLIGNFIHVIGPISNLLNKGIENKFSYELKNAYWIKKAKPNANTTVRFWSIKHRKLPLGFLQGLKKTLNDYADYKKIPINIIVHDKRVFVDDIVKLPDKFLNGIVLRDYQTEAVEVFLKNKIGVLEIATGAGKTEISIEIIRRLKMKTLFIVDKIELLRQTKKRMEDALGVEIGQLGQGVEDIKQITVATVQTIIKHISKYASYLRTVRLCVFDECHHCSSISFQRISQQLINSEYRCGLCLHFQTNILDNKGHIKNIRNIKIGDKILSYNHKNNKVEEDVVSNIFSKEVNEVYRISVKKENGHLRKIKCSSEHKFFINGKYIKAKDLSVGDNVKVFINPHGIFDNNSKKDYVREKISRALKGHKNTWSHKNKTLWKK